MRSRKTQAIPARLEAGRRRFERWRRIRKGHSRIPEPLWTSAAKLAGAYGLCRTARTLGLDYNVSFREACVVAVGAEAQGVVRGERARVGSAGGSAWGQRRVSVDVPTGSSASR